MRLPVGQDLAIAEGCRCCPDQRRSALAREWRFCCGALVAWSTAFASKPAPTNFAFRRQAGACRLCVRRWLRVFPGSIVGARLPANGDFAAAHLLPGPPRSPASRLLRTLRRRLQTLRSPKVAGVALINCRSALAREGDGAAAHLSSDPPRSPASRLLRTLHFPASRRLQTLRSL